MSTIAGFGGGVLSPPAFVAVPGVRHAVAVLAVARPAGNGSRVWFDRHEVARRPVGVSAPPAREWRRHVEGRARRRGS
ncbi:hypothetical protein GCM10010269_79820 [Streptomyces humidus]|uniref:Uncharacterized protein n=1 Tax=Streptomyces humidus TaxID=52259 RepID=A0A918GD39_9ACTN|nr:hypothetical protein [Streptomyces humidus]GGS29142.1 hypothetical protein GCM10010269_79820 [Streptomyces humidus]